ncbi:MAG: DUF4355 domain-containing protein [Peptostreptococcaceae bacterium]
MLKKELLEILKEIGDDQEVNETILEIEDFAKSSKISLEQFKELIEKDPEIKGYNQSNLDRAITNGIESFKSKGMQKLIDEAIAKSKNEGLSPEQIKIRDLEAKFADMEREKRVIESKSGLSKLLSTKNLPVDLVDYVYHDDENILNENIEKFTNMFSSVATEQANKILNDNSYVPPTSSGSKYMSEVERIFAKNTGISIE